VSEKPLDPATCLTLARGVKMRFDEIRGQWMLNAPERVLVLDEIAKEILSRCDGGTRISDLCWQLAIEFAEPLETVEADVMELLQDLLHRGFLRQ
jgi:pyrroloquinoline quinone biosynthesis protein D